MKKRFEWRFVGIFLCGMLWGVAICYLIGGLFVKRHIVQEYKSKLGVKETAEKIAKNAAATGTWQARVSACSLPQPSDSTPMNVITLCNPKIAKAIVDDQKSRRLASVIPCQFAVYQKSDGSVVISRLNFSLIGYMLGGTAAEMAARATQEQMKIMDDVIAK
jgi:uncharacterized protein (DUF302 family)